jgi:predicted GIY-YIG superfamily endonuclease
VFTAPTLKDKLVHSDLTPVTKPSWLPKPRGNFPCGNHIHCHHIVKTNTFRDTCGPGTHKVQSFVNCNTTYVVYRLVCPRGGFYIGRTKRRLKDRVSEHAYAIRAANDKYPMAKHYRQVGHGSPNSLKATAIEVVPSSN